MKIYEVEVTIGEKIDLPEDVEIPKGMDRDDIREFTTHTFHIGADYFGTAMDIAVEKIEELFFPDTDSEDIQYDINGVRELQDIYLVNWPGEVNGCSCPYCVAESIGEEDVMKVECPKCHAILRVADNGWEGILCSECKTEIIRDSLCLMGKNYKVIHIADTNKPI